ncbi:MAG: TM0996/MTH895 family glutaredoxin-like protein [Candidatus Omnitrophica bacterium]|nr:TM0996/MTH895 family glutaredoxin-like protein [Candidatus Omnitrophota bacterium]MBU1925916.1 TM0996/MTH895 family glutaredoxin-like protein [Candidatus Omnitrophota bacterium]MBU2064146.1 TM0996/MTH895 family glutaredoxin-like protein [Candidatus Omnitrophota bacterium]
MKIEILGMGCAKCRLLYENVQVAVRAAGIEAEVIKVETIDKITGYGVMMTPALVIDGRVKSSGNVPSLQEIKKWLEK